MTEKEFIRDLMCALDGSVPQRVMEENSAFYHEYFTKQRQEGKSNEEILQEIGSVEEIAATIVQMSGEENFYRSAREAGVVTQKPHKHTRSHYMAQKRKSRLRGFFQRIFRSK